MARLRELPWGALHGLAPALAGPVGEVLSGAAAERVLDRFLRSRPDLRREGRKVAAEAIFGAGLWRLRLRFHAGAEAGPLLLLASLLRDLSGREDAEALCGLPRGSLPPPSAPPSDLARFYSLPGWLAAELERAVGKDAPLLADALGLPGPVFLRANRARIDRDALATRLAAEGIETRPTQLAPDGLEVRTPRPGLLSLPAYREGLLEVQDEGSQLVGLAVGALPGETVLDLCAGAGGKALQLAAAVGPSGRVLACDPDAGRLARLTVRAARARARVEVLGAQAPAGLLVDRVLVDAPCSELGPLRRGPDRRFLLDPAGFAALPTLQSGILRRAAGHVRPGGRLVYATCTFRREENEEVAEALLRDEPGLARAEAIPGLGDADGCLRLLPHLHGTDGFFAAAFTRPG